MDFAHYWFGGGGDNPIPFPIGESLRYRRGQYLARTPASAGNRTTWTYSCWFKRGTLFNNTAGYSELVGTVFAAGTTFNQNDWNLDQYRFRTDHHNFQAWCRNSDSNRGSFITDAVYRDCSAWYHVVIAYDSSNATAGDRVRFYINGTRATTTVPVAMAQNRAGWVNGTNVHRIGSGTSEHTQGYFAEVHFLDGTAVTDANLFGEFNPDGVWVPINVTGVTYGGNGWYLDFSDPNNIGADRSGNGNNFTPAGFELANTSSTSYDWMADSPTDNFSTLNPLHWNALNNQGTNGPQYQNANLRTTSYSEPISPYSRSTGSTVVVNEGAWYHEVTVITSNNGWDLGAASANNVDGNGNWTRRWTFNPWDSQLTLPSGVISYGNGISNGDVFGCAVDIDNDTIEFFRNGTSLGQRTSIGFAANESIVLGPVMGWWSNTVDYNYGNRPFQHTPPAGFEPLSTAGLPNVAITNPSEHFDVILDTGANILGSAQAAFPSGMIWIKDRVNNNQHQIFDHTSSRVLRCPANGDFAYTAPSGNSVAWCWALPATGTQNTAGSLETTNFVNEAAGMSLTTWTGTGNYQTVGHGLSRAPQFIMNWWEGGPGAGQMQVGSDYLANGWSSYLELNWSQAPLNSQTRWNNTAPTDTVVSVGASCNQNGATQHMYSWYPVPGFSAFGTYRANSSTDGAYCSTDFAPKFLLIKQRDGNNNWVILDSERVTYNPRNRFISPDNVNPENNPPASETDFLSNGFKIRTTWSGLNQPSGGIFLWAAFAVHPFGGGNVAPSPAR